MILSFYDIGKIDCLTSHFFIKMAQAGIALSPMGDRGHNSFIRGPDVEAANIDRAPAEDGSSTHVPSSEGLGDVKIKPIGSWLCAEGRTPFVGIAAWHR